jgi:coniferyl-aldehyde dehydrogenase
MRGLQVLPLGEHGKPGERLFAPTVVLEPGDDALVMQEEIFGPILPIKSYRNLDEAIAYVNAHDRPLSLYPFSHDRGSVEKILRNTLAGGVTVNDTVLHFGINNLPFGGIGPSGMGAYHGRAGFDASARRCLSCGNRGARAATCSSRLIRRWRASSISSSAKLRAWV